MILSIEKKRAVEHAIDKTALEQLGAKLGRYTAGPLDLKLILQEAVNEIDRIKENWKIDRGMLIKFMKEREELDGI